MAPVKSAPLIYRGEFCLLRQDGRCRSYHSARVNLWRSPTDSYSAHPELVEGNERTSGYAVSLPPPLMVRQAHHEREEWLVVLPQPRAIG